MPLPRAVARLNKRYTNRLIEPLVARLPGFAVVAHRGRISGSSYRTPVYAFNGGDSDAVNRVFVALTYGPSADWAQNVLAGGGELHRDGAATVIEAAVLVNRSAAWGYLPLGVRATLRILRVTDFVQMAVRQVLADA